MQRGFIFNELIFCDVKTETTVVKVSVWVDTNGVKALRVVLARHLGGVSGQWLGLEGQ